jgi:hypothetical protein
MSPLIALALTAALHAPAAPHIAPASTLLAHATRVAAAVPPLPAARAARGAWAQPARDSLKNGARIGAIVGGLVTGAAVGALCYQLNDGDNRGAECTRATLLWAGMGAAGGAAIGVGIDALFMRAPVARVRVRF